MRQKQPPNESPENRKLTHQRANMVGCVRSSPPNESPENRKLTHQRANMVGCVRSGHPLITRKSKTDAPESEYGRVRQKQPTQ
ncbi:hypothetical protein AP9108_19580 [Arthrospira sp. PCC 9108]|nr:hypothetical protein AP9108_19580 [Arthrospira sp. PCC 9108]